MASEGSSAPRIIATVKPSLTEEEPKSIGDQGERTHGAIALEGDEQVEPVPKAKAKAKSKTTSSQLTDLELHNLDHELKRPDCPTCNEVRVQQRHHGHANEPSRLQATKFGDHITADHFIAEKEFDRGIDACDSRCPHG